jgi:hypothetical protein
MSSTVVSEGLGGGDRFHRGRVTRRSGVQLSLDFHARRSVNSLGLARPVAAIWTARMGGDSDDLDA